MSKLVTIDLGDKRRAAGNRPSAADYERRRQRIAQLAAADNTYARIVETLRGEGFPPISRREAARIGRDLVGPRTADYLQQRRKDEIAQLDSRDGRILSARDESIVNMRKQGLSFAQIALNFPAPDGRVLSRAYVHFVCKRAGITSAAAYKKKPTKTPEATHSPIRVACITCQATYTPTRPGIGRCPECGGTPYRRLSVC